MPEIKIKLTNTTSFYWDVTIGNETFRMGYQGGTIETVKYGRFFFDTPYYGITDTQQIFKLSDPLNYEFQEIK